VARLIAYTIADNTNISANIYNMIRYIEEKVKNLKNTVEVWDRRRTDRQTLAHMSDRLLEDIGLTYGEIQNEINKPFWVK